MFCRSRRRRTDAIPVGVGVSALAAAILIVVPRTTCRYTPERSRVSMRLFLRAMCAAALAGCADAKAPVETTASTLFPSDPTGRPSEHPSQTIDGRSLAD